MEWHFRLYSFKSAYSRAPQGYILSEWRLIWQAEEECWLTDYLEVVLGMVYDCLPCVWCLDHDLNQGFRARCKYFPSKQMCSWVHVFTMADLLLDPSKLDEKHAPVAKFEHLTITKSPLSLSLWKTNSYREIASNRPTFNLSLLWPQVLFGSFIFCSSHGIAISLIS